MVGPMTPRTWEATRYDARPSWAMQTSRLVRQVNAWEL